jgi:tetratricopeptide (TPR) repeat protein
MPRGSRARAVSGSRGLLFRSAGAGLVRRWLPSLPASCNGSSAAAGASRSRPRESFSRGSWRRKRRSSAETSGWRASIGRFRPCPGPTARKRAGALLATPVTSRARQPCAPASNAGAPCCRDALLVPGGALALAQPVEGVARAARRLRERHSAEAAGGRAVWIAVDPETWDAVSRRAFESAARGLAEQVETVACSRGGNAPLYPDEWRREIFVPCGALRASLRFFEEFAVIVREDPAGARLAASELLASPGWAPFASDPTGDAPLPARFAAPRAGAFDRPPDEQSVVLQLLVCDRPAPGEALTKALPGTAARRALARLAKRGEVQGDAAGRWTLSPGARASASFSAGRCREACRRWAVVEDDPARRIEWFLSAGDLEAALEAGEAWKDSLPPGSPERWFDLSARLAAACPSPLPPWLEALEAERDVAGGRPEDAESRLERQADWPAASPAERSQAALRRIEILSRRGRFPEAARLAAAWRRAQPEAESHDTVRALRVEAGARGREGQHEAALELLDEADRRGAGLPLQDGIETALARARVYSLAGRFREEAETYGRFRAAVLEDGDEALAARFLSQEALGLADRRDFAGAIARLEEALAVLGDEPAGRAAVLIDLAGTLYHAERPSRCEALLGAAAAAAASAGREDLVRTARANRVELLINRCDWEAAAREIADLVALAREQHDNVRLLVALHHRGRLALRRGQLAAAARDNEDARGLALRCRDRLELGEL